MQSHPTDLRSEETVAVRVQCHHVDAEASQQCLTWADKGKGDKKEASQQCLTWAAKETRRRLLIRSPLVTELPLTTRPGFRV